ncbi:MAG: hypothetical protein R2815_09865 [Flavobacteriales bacterium]|nr:hypothetical protein [Flavobacteriales bacterium]
MSTLPTDTALATIDRSEDGIIRIRFKHEVRVDVSGLAEILQARRDLAGDDRPGVMALLPEDLDFDNAILTTDHHAGSDPRTFTKAFAIVTRSHLLVRLYSIYATYFKQDFPVRTFDDEDAAVQWLHEQVGSTT